MEFSSVNGLTSFRMDLRRFLRQNVGMFSFNQSDI